MWLSVHAQSDHAILRWEWARVYTTQANEPSLHGGIVAKHRGESSSSVIYLIPAKSGTIIYDINIQIHMLHALLSIVTCTAC